MPPSYRKPTATPNFARAILVGESNPYSRNPDDALLPYPAQSAGARLRGLLGWTEDEYLESFWRVNLIRGRCWHQAEAEQVAAKLVIDALRHDLDVVMLGARVAAAFSKPPLEPWARDGNLVRVPHPSGRCREWYKPGARERLRRLMGRYLVPCYGIPHARWAQ